MSKFVGLLLLLLITVVVAEYDYSPGYPPDYNDYSPEYPPEDSNHSPEYPPEYNDYSPGYPPEYNDYSPEYPPDDNNHSPEYPPEDNDHSPEYPPEHNDHSPRYPPEHNHRSPEYSPEHEKHGPCGKFSTLRMVTHKLRHCKKAARDVKVPVSSECCKDLAKVSIPCLHAVFSSDAFKKVGIDPKIAITIPHRCHLAKPPEISPIPRR